MGFSVKDVDAAMKAMEEDGAKIEVPAREVPGLVKVGFVVDPFGTRLEIVQDPCSLDCITFICVDRIQVRRWHGMWTSSAVRSANSKVFLMGSITAASGCSQQKVKPRRAPATRSITSDSVRRTSTTPSRRSRP